MSKTILKLGIGRLCLMSFILFCSVFTSVNAFSRKHWQKKDLLVIPNPKKRNIIFEFLFYLYCPARNEYGYLDFCDFLYSEDGINYTHLMRANAKGIMSSIQASIVIHDINPDEKILLSRNLYNHPNATLWHDSEVWVDQQLMDRQYKVGKNEVTTKIALMKIKWDLSNSSKDVKFFKAFGFWSVNDKSRGDTVHEIYPVKSFKSNSNTIQNTPSILKSEISNNVKVSGETDTINITCAEPGENFKIYTASGVEVKSLVANDDVVNIKLPTNQTYIVKAGQTRYKLAL